MNIYTLFPLIATIAYIPLLVTTISTRPWQQRHRLFLFFLVPAMLWSLTSVLLRSNFFPQLNFLFLQIILITLALTGVQFYRFASSFFAPGERRWLPFAYISLAGMIALILFGYIPEGVTQVNGEKLYLDYGWGVIFLAIPLVTLAIRMTYVFWRRLRVLDNPMLRSQIVSLLLGLAVLLLFIFGSLLPWGREFPIAHLGNLIAAFILSYAAIRHQLLDIRLVLRRGLLWLILGTIGATTYGLLLVLLNNMLNFALDLTGTLIAIAAATGVAIFVYRLRDYLFRTMGKAFQGKNYDYRQQLADFADKIHGVFSLTEQGGELLVLITRAVGCRRAALLFPEADTEIFTTRFTEPGDLDNPLSTLKLTGNNPVVEFLRREQKLLMRETLSILPEFRSLWEQEKKEITAHEIELIVPLISREKLIGILVLDRKRHGRYSLEDLRLLENIVGQVAVSIEKEYLRERLREREEELSVINRSSAIITSSLDIQEIYDNFIHELKKVVDVSWASIALVKGDNLHVLALFSEIGSAWKVGERLPLRGTATEWVTHHQEIVVEPDLTQESRFVNGKLHLNQGIRSLVSLPLLAKGKAIGSLTVASCQPNAYSPRHITLLEQLTSQIAMPVENSQLYAEVEEKARKDELTGLLNRRSLDELIASEVSRHSRYGGILSIIILDLDSFKLFNDTYGHLAGDKLLHQIGSVMKKSIRGSDQAFRYGGDEFAILLPNTPLDAAIQVSDRVRKKIAADIESGHIPVTASLGLASWPADGISATEVIAAADSALYLAKRTGGNRSQCASGTLLPLEETTETIPSPTETRNGETLSTIYALAITVDARDHYTRHHSKKAGEYATALAEALNLAPSEITRLETCALLHDIGKISISDQILNKPGKLTPAEWAVIKTHPQVGVNIASHAPQLAPCLAGILHHHERYDGTGYPEGLKGDDIPLEARILAIADAFAAMTTLRSYSQALSAAEAREELKRGAGTQFDPHLIKVFLSITGVATPPVTEKVRR